MGTLTDASKGPELDADQVLAVPFGDPLATIASRRSEATPMRRGRLDLRDTVSQ